MEHWKGLHFLLDFYNVDVSRFAWHDAESFIVSMVKKSGLTCLWSFCHIFDQESQAFTLAVVLSESHITIHTWPEKNYVTADIFICNMYWDYTQQAETFKNSLREFLNVDRKDMQEKIINR